MALLDDRKFLLSHIHHSFITCDDTGTCETVMINEVVTDKPVVEDHKHLQLGPDYFGAVFDEDLLEGGHSYDIVSDMEHIGAHRLRSNTAQRLDRLKRDKQAQANIKNVHWKPAEKALGDKELLELFPKKELKKEEEVLPKTSALSQLLELYPAMPDNPFSEYTRFDGRISRVAQTKKIQIFLTILPPAKRDYPMEVVCLANARVHDLIGLICWQYTNEDREPVLKSTVSNYCLRIAEETGEVDEDFPALDPKELVAKFGFPVLALVERNNPVTTASSITIRIEDEFTKLEIPNLYVTLREIIEQIRRRRKWLKRTTNFHVESLHESGIPLNLDSKIADLGVLDFRLVIEETATKDALIDDWNTQQLALIEAPLHKSFNVVFTQKMGRNSDVILGISDEKVEISPLPQKGAAKFLSKQQRPITYYMKDIACCEIVSKKYNPGKALFKIVHTNGQEFKSLTFEADPQTGTDVVKKLQIILNMKFNTAQKDYQMYRERKLKKKLQKTPHSLSF